MNKTLIFGLLDGVCFLASEKLLRKEESKRWLEGFKGVVMVS